MVSTSLRSAATLGEARRTGRALDVPFAHVWTFSGDSVVRFVQFVDTAGWNAALAPGPGG